MKTYKNHYAFDTETTGLNVTLGARPFCVAITDGEGNSQYFRWEYDPMTRKVTISDETLNALKKIFGNKNATYIAHNAKFDYFMLKSIGVEIKGTLVDTVVMAHIENNSRSTYKLKPLCKALLKYPDKDEKDLKDSVIKARRLGKKNKWLLAEDVEADYAIGDKKLCKDYCIHDTIRCMELFKFCDSKFSKKQQETLAMEIDLTRVLIDMEGEGICIDAEKAEELADYYYDIIKKAETLKEKLGFKNLNTRSPKQMHDTFYKKLNANPVYTMAKNKYGVRQKKLTANKKALEKWSKTYPLAKAIVDINTAQHELGSFIKPLYELRDDNGRVHPNYRQTGTVTGRLSCANPNLQNISNSKDEAEGRVSLRARELFIPAPGHVLYFPDYSQIEVWISAYISEDPIMCTALANGYDMHGDFNKKFYGRKTDFIENKSLYRKKVKTGTFCTIYGGGVPALSSTLGCSESEASDFLNAFRETYSELTNYGNLLTGVAYKHGWIENPFGRKLTINQDVAYKALNYMVQGTASEVMKRALININNLFKTKYIGCKLLLTIHDEVCIEVPNRLHSKRLMRDIVTAMQGDFHSYLDMPCKFPVSMGWTSSNWANKVEIAL